MSRLMENVTTINSAVRTLLAVVITGAVGVGGWYGYNVYNAGEIEANRNAQQLEAAQRELEDTQSQLKLSSARLDRAQTELVEKEGRIQEQADQLKQKEVEIGQLNDQVAEQKQEIERLDASLRLLKVNHRVARITVLDQTTDPQTGEKSSVIQFQELDDQGQPVDEPRQFHIAGDVIYVDSWVVKFDDKYVEQADIDRSTSLVLFRRVFGEYQEPSDGFSLDAEGARPSVYGRGAKMSEFEKQIWDDFWSVANDEPRQEQLGVRAAHGEAPSIKLQKGRTYRLDLRASDGLSIRPDGTAPPKPSKPPA